MSTHGPAPDSIVPWRQPRLHKGWDTVQLARTIVVPRAAVAARSLDREVRRVRRTRPRRVSRPFVAIDVVLALVSVMGIVICLATGFMWASPEAIARIGRLVEAAADWELVCWRPCALFDDIWSASVTVSGSGGDSISAPLGVGLALATIGALWLVRQMAAKAADLSEAHHVAPAILTWLGAGVAGPIPWALLIMAGWLSLAAACYAVAYAINEGDW